MTFEEIHQQIAIMENRIKYESQLIQALTQSNMVLEKQLADLNEHAVARPKGPAVGKQEEPPRLVYSFATMAGYQVQQNP